VDTRAVTKLTLLLAIGAAVACTGRLDEGNTPSSAAAGASASNGGAANGGTSPAVVSGASNAGATTTAPPADCGPKLTRAPLRRLIRFEYDNSVRDLLGDTSHPASALPSEELGNGFGNDAEQQAVVSVLVEQYLSVAEKVAANATSAAKLSALAPCATQVKDAASEVACARTIAESFTPKAWRRPLAPGDADGLVELFSSVRATADFPTSIAALLEAVFQSPEFLYKPEVGVSVAGRSDVKQPTGDEMATRLSYLFWASTPDDALRSAAASGQLATAEGVRAQAQRLLADPKAREVVRFFFDKLLPIESLAALERDKTLYPKFSSKVGSLLRTETQTFLENEIFTSNGSWPGVFTAQHTYVNQELAAFYGISGVSGEAFQKVALDPATHRGGLLTQAGVVAGPIHSNNANPVVRGSFVVQKLMCLPIPRPTGDIAAKVTVPDPASAATARQRFASHSSDAVCRGCHVNMDPVGFALENFDPVGQWRDQENGVTIDATGQSPALGGFNGPLELEQALASSEQVQRCFASNWMNFGYGRTLTAEEACGVESVQSKFKEAGYNVQELLLALTQSEAFLTLPAVSQ